MSEKKDDIIDSLYNHQNNVNKTIEPKEGEHWRLYSNNADICSPSLGFKKYPNTSDMPVDVALDYLAQILVEIFLQTEHDKQSEQ
jgi:hypothetical protein